MKYFLSVIFFSFLFSPLASQGVVFSRITLDDALDRAKRENKSVLVDCYATWCVPCKKMDRVFAQREVGSLFNDNFINIKLDMDLVSSYGPKTEYEIIFLPTIMILDPQGNVRYKKDKVLGVEEILQIGELALNPDIYFASEATKITSSPIQQSGSAASQEESREEPSIEKIVYVLDGENGNVPPEILYQEAYFRMELMDGSQNDAARRYLETQEDWTTEKNLRFIYDFLNQSEGELFEFYINNQHLFSQHIDPEQLRLTTSMVVSKRLYQGFPRPDLNEAQVLFGFIDQEMASKNAHRYFIRRLKEESDMDGFIKVASEYLKFNDDDIVLYLYIDQLLSTAQMTSEEATSFKARLQDKLLLKPEKPELHELLARLYLKDNDKQNALKHIDQAVSFYHSEKDRQKAEGIKTEINQL